MLIDTDFTFFLYVKINHDLLDETCSSQQMKLVHFELHLRGIFCLKSAHLEIHIIYVPLREEGRTGGAR